MFQIPQFPHTLRGGDLDRDHLFRLEQEGVERGGGDPDRLRHRCRRPADDPLIRRFGDIRSDRLVAGIHPLRLRNWRVCRIDRYALIRYRGCCRFLPGYQAV